MRKRFPFEADGIFYHYYVCWTLQRRCLAEVRQFRSIIPLACKFPSLIKENDLDTVQEQWRSLKFARESIAHMRQLEPPAFWLQLGQITDGNGQPKFGLLSVSCCALTALIASFFSVR
jgi:hypothetical protein